VEVAAEFAVAVGRVAHQVPDGYKDRARDGDQGFHMAATFDDASVAGAEEGIGAAGGYWSMSDNKTRRLTDTTTATWRDPVGARAAA
jgi:hypothetical protein